jgi:5'-3' exonuclease
VRLHVVDGTFELFRAHFSQRPASTAPDGRSVKATLGLVEQMVTLLCDRDEAPTHLAVAFDNPIRSFRNDLFAGYKGDEGVPPELRAQFDLVEEALSALGIVVWSMDRFEADDALATAAHRFGASVDQVRILSPDKDLMQCVQNTHVVLVDRMRRRIFDDAAVRAHWGVGPAQIPDLLALTGDSADGIPGLPGFGPKTAAALLTAFGGLDAIPTDPRAWPRSLRGAERLAPVLGAHVADVLLSRRLATLVLDVPLAEDLEALRVGTLGGPAFDAFAARLGASRVAERAAERLGDAGRASIAPPRAPQ